MMQNELFPFILPINAHHSVVCFVLNLLFVCVLLPHEKMGLQSKSKYPGQVVLAKNRRITEPAGFLSSAFSL